MASVPLLDPGRDGLDNQPPRPHWHYCDYCPNEDIRCRSALRSGSREEGMAPAHLQLGAVLDALLDSSR